MYRRRFSILYTYICRIMYGILYSEILYEQCTKGGKKRFIRDKASLACHFGNCIPYNVR